MNSIEKIKEDIAGRIECYKKALIGTSSRQKMNIVYGSKVEELENLMMCIEKLNKAGKRCKNCVHYVELRIAGTVSRKYTPYCDQGAMYMPCKGGECEYPEFYEAMEEEK